MKKNQRRCLKFTGYIYVPYDGEVKEEADVRRWIREPSPGRITFYDEFGDKEEEKAFAFGSLSHMVAEIEQRRKDMFKKRRS